VKTRVRRAVIVGLVVVAALAGTRLTRGSVHPAAASTGPNVVVIEVDDMRMDELQYMTKTLAALPGTNFTHSYVSTSLCCPSRAAFLSGQYAQNNGVGDNNSYSQFDHTSTLATWMQNGGYFTSIIGKYLNGYSCTRPQPPGWSHWQALCHNIYNMFKYSVDDNGVIRTYGTQQSDYQTDVIAQRAVATIDEGVASGKPFFLWVTPTAPHSGSGIRTPTRYRTLYSRWLLPHGPSFNEADLSDKPAWVRALPNITGSSASSIQTAERVRLRMLASADDLVQSIVDELRAKGVDGNTDILFTSDNGFMHGEHRIRNGKEVLYAESLLVPLLGSGPGFPVGTNSAPVMNTDLAPTILDLAGVSAPATWPFDGRSIMPAVADAHVFDGRALLHKQVGDLTAPKHPGGLAVQADQFIYDELATGETELYDHRADPYELRNAVKDPRYAAVVAQMSQLLGTLRTCAGSSCMVTRADLPPDAALTASCVSHSTTCSFDASASSDIDGSIASIDWDFGDGTTAPAGGATISHTYTTPGTYTVTATVTDDRGVASPISQPVTTGVPNVPPTAAFTPTVNGAQIDFDASASSDSDGSIVDYSWDFGDGTTGYGVTASHTYSTYGDYLVRLTVTDDYGALTTTSQLVTPNIPDQLPIASFTVSKSGRTVNLDASASYDPDGVIVDIQWDFGDGTVVDTAGDGSANNTGTAPSHTYSSNGTYTIVLTVTDDRQGSAQASQTITVP
jgi:arylsulfatase A-like enzyme